MKIEILGMGCPKCEKLFANVERAVRENKVEAEIVKVNDMDQIVDRGILVTPAIIVDGKVIACGKVLSSEELVTHMIKDR